MILLTPMLTYDMIAKWEYVELTYLGRYNFVFNNTVFYT